MLSIAVIGYGYWGPNIIRNVSRLSSVSASWICDLNPMVLADIPRLYPTIRTTTEIANVLNDPHTHAVIIATPPSTHFQFAKKVLLRGKHVLVEKPLTQTVNEAATLVSLAQHKKKILMVDHTFLYTPAVLLIKKIISSGVLGTIVTVDSVRTNLGLFQKDSNVISDLAVHDFSIMDYLFNSAPDSIAATGITDRSLKQETVAYVSAHYKNNIFLHTHVSWMSPIKIRRMMIVGTKKMLLYDDMEPSEKIKIYDKSVSVDHDPKNEYLLRVGYRSGAVHIPHIDIEEGLFGLIQEFVHAMRTQRKLVRTDGNQGLRVVSSIVAATKSIRNGGKTVKPL